MARIPVEKRTGHSLWPWLIGLLLLIGVVWIVVALTDEEPDVAAYEQLEENADTLEGTSGSVPATGAITTVSMITDAPDRLDLVGRQVRLNNLRVTSVVGDSTFYVTPADSANTGNRRLFVVLNEQATPNQPGVEGRYDVNAGQVLTLYGTLEALDRTDPQVWGITPQEADRMQNDQVYLRAQRLDITQKP